MARGTDTCDTVDVIRSECGAHYGTCEDKAISSASHSFGVFASPRVANPRKGRLRDAEADHLRQGYGGQAARAILLRQGYGGLKFVTPPSVKKGRALPPHLYKSGGGGSGACRFEEFGGKRG